MAQTLPADLTLAALRQQRIAALADIEDLVRLFRPAILRFVTYSIGDRDVAESITQDCFLMAYKLRNQFRGECGLKTWLMRIALNLIRSHTRTMKFRFWKAAPRIEVEALADSLASGNDSPEEQIIAKEQLKVVRQALDRLSPRQRTVFLMHFVEDLDLAEISAATGMSVTTVKTHLYRAVRAIRAKLGGGL
jgi:RNA polymerase sigma-70 factor (ECF subfamily)